jgi:methyl-accepting chemotaxis protein
MESKKLSTAERKVIFEAIKKQSDAIMNYALAAYFLFGIFLSFFYDTYFIAVGVGGLSIAAYFVVKALMPHSNLYQYVLSGVFAIFAAQFIYQMHGLFEMHFFVFVGSTLLITYQNWRLQLPLIILVVIHHASFAYIQYLGYKEIYFTQLDYMDLQAFIFHGALAAVIVAICGYWAYDLEKKTVSESVNKIALENQLKSVSKNIEFAEQISSGNLTVEYQLQNDQDELGNALLSMRENLLKASMKENQEKFVTIGITQVGDVIRNNPDSLQKLSDDFVRTVVKYMGMNQGGLFLHEKENESEYLNLTACYAYDRKKYLERKISTDEGLVGQCFMERDVIYMTRVPQDYVQITSGLGEVTPGCIILVPVMTADEIVGVFELASFKPLEQYKIDFLRKVCENIASSIVSSRVTERVKRLLAESQQQTEEMRAQEEEMRQNMEELQATQEEMRRKEQHAQEILQAAHIKAERTAQIRSIMKKLVKDSDVQTGNWEAAIDKIMSSAFSFMNVSRVGLWLLNEDQDILHCGKLYSSKRAGDPGNVLKASEYPYFFRSIIQEDELRAEDVTRHTALHELLDPYFKPNNITSVLGVPIYDMGRVTGIILCEHNQERSWTEEDGSFLRRCADLVTVVHKSNQIKKLTGSMSMN